MPDERREELCEAKSQEAARGASVSVSGLEQGAVALLDGIVAREDVLGVVAAKWQVKGVKFETLLKNTPLTRRFASRRPMETLKSRVSAQKFKAFSRIDRKAVVLGFDDVVEKGVSLKNARLMGDALVASKQEGAQGFHKVWVSDAPIKAE